ncbi:hypothetical protein K504DRAFT_464622 [Pleomassaria siparia CBS 279.74]|uniref:Uncharacterized protein n=1 Tax=Pleomassaria siparia CBS 279.74 TaxID=1314801 RepID=A0A6G1KJ15_9PLEO|nr:hypothetical protein K504DRAFT_464622 [Pleomassaria siparia CBS 279.74]
MYICTLLRVSSLEPRAKNDDRDRDRDGDGDGDGTTIDDKERSLGRAWQPPRRRERRNGCVVRLLAAGGYMYVGTGWLIIDGYWVNAEWLLGECWMVTG